MSAPPLVFNEPLATGWLRTELHGERDLAARYTLEARRLLGSLRTIHGVDARLAAGEPGGFYKMSATLGDGTRIEAISNDGHDTVRIYAARPAPAAPPARPAARAGADYRPSLWIGVRIVDGERLDFTDNGFAYTLHACLWEPAAKGAVPVILSNRNELVAPDDNDGTDRYPLQPWKQFLPYHGDAASKMGIAYTDDKLAMLLPRNEVPMHAPGDGADGVTWDVIFVADPDNELKLGVGLGGGLDDIPLAGNPAGDYMLKVMLCGDDCAHYAPATVEVRVITGKGDGIDDQTTQFKIDQYTRYHMGILPLGWFDPLPAPGGGPCETCALAAPDHGPNPHGPHWWQGAASVFVAPLQAGVAPAELVRSATTFSKDGDVTLPPTGFEPAGFPARAERCTGCVSVSTQYGIFGGTSDMTGGPFGGGDCTGLPFIAPLEVSLYARYQIRLFGPTGAAASHLEQLHADYGLSLAVPYIGNQSGHTDTFFYTPGAGPQVTATSPTYEWTVPEGAMCIGGIWSPGALTAFGAQSSAARNAQIGADTGTVPYETYSAYYKYRWQTDHDGQEIPNTRFADWISPDEYNSAPRTRGDLYVTCAKVETP